MPTYEYQCKTCGHQFEQFQRYSDPVLTECPRCSGAIRRVIFPAGVIFKGSGWYITDSRKTDSAAPAGGDGKAAAASADAGDKAAADTGSAEKAPSSDKSTAAEKAPVGAAAGSKPAPAAAT